MDDLIAKGGIAIAALYAAGALGAVAVGAVLASAVSSLTSGEPARAAATIALLVAAAAIYAGAGYWLQRTGRI